MALTLFGFIKKIIQTNDIKYYDSLEDSDKKVFSSFMTQRFLSMNPNFIELVNFINKYTFILSDAQYYKLTTLLIPNQKQTFYKYIKNKKDKMINKSVLNCIQNFYLISTKEAAEYYSILSNQQLFDIVKKYGLQEKELKKIKKELKLK